MLLRASSKALGEEVELEASVGRGESGVPHGELLVPFAEAATRGSEELPEIRRRLLEAVGPAGFVEAAATVGIFNGLVRVADATGIPLDDGTLRASRGFRKELGLDAFAGSGFTELDATGEGETGDNVAQLFGFAGRR